MYDYNQIIKRIISESKQSRKQLLETKKIVDSAISLRHTSVANIKAFTKPKVKSQNPPSVDFVSPLKKKKIPIVKPSSSLTGSNRPTKIVQFDEDDPWL